MKCFLLLALIAAGALAQAPAGRQVYVMPMAGGLDQYLAAQITHAHVMQVVTDPKAADVIMTDRIGDAFEQRMTELFPPPKSDDKKDDKKDDKTAGAVRTSFRSTAARGTIFLVDAKSRQVVWSDHEKPVETTDRELNREAARIVKKLEPPTAK